MLKQKRTSLEPTQHLSVMGFHISDSRSTSECQKDQILFIMSSRVQQKLHQQVKAVMTLSRTIKCRQTSEERTEGEIEIEIEIGEIYREQMRAHSSVKKNISRTVKRTAVQI